MWDNSMTVMMLEGIRDTIYMTVVSTFFGYLVFPLELLLHLRIKMDSDKIRQYTGSLM